MLDNSYQIYFLPFWCFLDLVTLSAILASGTARNISQLGFSMLWHVNQIIVSFGQENEQQTQWQLRKQKTWKVTKHALPLNTRRLCQRSQISKCPAQDVDNKCMLNFQSGNRLDVKDSFLVFMVWYDLFIWKTYVRVTKTKIIHLC